MGSFALMLFALLGCKPSAEEEAKIATRLKAEAERQEELCRDKTSCGEKPPVGLKVDYTKHALRKWNNHWFLVPRDYDAHFGMKFRWPSRTTSGRDPTKHDPNDWVVQLQIRSHDIPPEPRGHRRLEIAAREGRVSNRVTLRPGLDRLEYRDVDRATGVPSKYFVFTEYVATDRRDPEGQPPVLRCRTDLADPQNAGGGGGFVWREGILVEILIRSGNICEDWPEIYDEVIRVLELTEKV
ncbi:hypothetical protein [Paucibacter sp. XJ19-41]|uniref:hypothetical protein n=1 Tax=Paucibacter sp. XJ19-41 TaxID=2927824 RepID=UPI0023490E1F|nr:hypothetical protein [Paucibacter sp. XJ19-41]MDC6168286.1 hypothetical protein [Paucibacter sp. XJ19-41]